MKYVILQYFFLVHFCNIKISVNSSRHGSKGLNYEIDSYTNQQYKAASNESSVRNRTERIQETDENQSKSDEVNGKNKDVKIKKEFSDKINVQAVMNDTISLSENLKLNYEYLIQKALEKSGRSNSETLAKSDAEDLSKESNTEKPVNKDLVRKIKGHIKHDATEKTKHHSKKKTINENKRSRDNAKDNDGTKDHNRYSETSHSDHSNTGDKRHEKSKKKHHLLVEQGYKDKVHSRELQNPELKVKTTVNQEESLMANDQEIKETEEILSSMSKENHNPPLSEEKNIELSITEENNTEVNIEDENVDAQIHNEHGNQKNVMILDDNPYGGVKTIRFEKSDDQISQEWSQQSSAEFQITKNQDNKDPNNPVIRKEEGKLYTYVQDPAYDDYHEELAELRKKHPMKNASVKTIKFENSDDQKSQERSAEVQITKKQENKDPNNPVIRKEGGKLYTYVQDPDYDDYHEELAEWRKKHPEKSPTDFI